MGLNPVEEDWKSSGRQIALKSIGLSLGCDKEEWKWSSSGGLLRRWKLPQVWRRLYRWQQIGGNLWRCAVRAGSHCYSFPTTGFSGPQKSSGGRTNLCTSPVGIMPVISQSLISKVHRQEGRTPVVHTVLSLAPVGPWTRLSSAPSLVFLTCAMGELRLSWGINEMRYLKHSAQDLAHERHSLCVILVSSW